MPFALLLLSLVCPANADELPLVAGGKIVDSSCTEEVAPDLAPKLLLRELQKRVPAAAVDSSAEPAVRFSLSKRFDLGPEGFELFIHDEKLDVVARGNLGLIYAVGEILRRSEWTREGVMLKLELNPWLSRPICLFRGILLDPVEGAEHGRWESPRLRELFEELALWGANTIALPLRPEWGDPANEADLGNSGEVAGRRARWERAAETVRLARELDLRVCAVLPANGVFPARVIRQPVLKATAQPGRTDRTSLACPTLTQGRLAILKTITASVRQLPHLDSLLLTPFDEGGCWCEKCQQRGWAEVYLDFAKRARDALQDDHPTLELMLSDWGFWQDGVPAEEWAKLVTTTTHEEADWIDWFALTRPAECPVKYPEVTPSRFGYFEAAPEGLRGFGAVPLLRSSPAVWKEYLEAARDYRGFLMRTTGVDDHLNVLGGLRWHWSPRRTPENLAGFVTRYYFGEEAAEKLIPAVLAMDEGSGGRSPFARGQKQIDDMRAEAREREETIREVGLSLGEELAEGPLFRSLLTRVEREARHWAAATE